MAMGQIYVPVSADAVRINSPLDTSGITGGGYWISWDSTTGFTGIPWSTYWYDPHCPLKSKWEADMSDGKADSCGQYHESTVEGFSDRISNGHATDLNNYLNDWNDADKLAFLKSVDKVFDNCVTSR